MPFSLQKGFLHLFSGSVLGRGLSFLLNVGFSRFLGAPTLGLYALALNAIQAFELFSKLGLDYALSLELTSAAKFKTHDEFSFKEIQVINQSLTLIVFTSIIGGISFAVWLLKGSAYLPISLASQRSVIAILLVIACFLESINSYLWDILLAKAWTKRYAIRSGIIAPLKIIFFAGGYFFAGTAGSFVFLIISALISWIMVLQLLPSSIWNSFKVSFDFALVKKLISAGNSLYLANTVNALVFLPLWSALASNSGLASLGYIRIGQLMVQLFALVPGSLMPAYFLKLRLQANPATANATKSQFLLFSSSALWSAGLVCLSTYVLLDKSLTSFLFGQQFIESLVATRVLVLSSVLDSVSAFYQTYYLAAEVSSIFLVAQLLPSFLIIALAIVGLPLIGLEEFLMLKLLASALPLLVYVLLTQKALIKMRLNILLTALIAFASFLPPGRESEFIALVWTTIFMSLTLLCFNIKSYRASL